MKIIKIPSIKNRISKFKTDTIDVEHLLRDRNVSVIGISDLDIIWNSGFENWEFRFVFRKANLFLSESTLTLPCSHPYRA
jgi:hypothetical protein